MELQLFFPFIIMFFILVVSIQLFQAMKITSDVNKNKYKIANNTAKNVTVQNIDGVTLYNINYDIPNKGISMSCGCPKGDVVNKFENIKVYNYNTHTSQYADTLVCACDSQYSLPMTPIFGSAEEEGFIDIIKYIIYDKIGQDKDKAKSIIDNMKYTIGSNNNEIIITVVINSDNGGLQSCLTAGNRDATMLPYFINAKYPYNFTISPNSKVDNASNITGVYIIENGIQLESDYTSQFVYKGDPELIRYMQSNDNYIFENDLYV